MKSQHSISLFFFVIILFANFQSVKASPPSDPESNLYYFVERFYTKMWYPNGTYAYTRTFSYRNSSNWYVKKFWFGNFVNWTVFVKPKFKLVSGNPYPQQVNFKIYNASWSYGYVLVLGQEEIQWQTENENFFDTVLALGYIHSDSYPDDWIVFIDYCQMSSEFRKELYYTYNGNDWLILNYSAGQNGRGITFYQGVILEDHLFPDYDYSDLGSGGESDEFNALKYDIVTSDETRFQYNYVLDRFLDFVYCYNGQYWVNIKNRTMDYGDQIIIGDPHYWGFWWVKRFRYVEFNINSFVLPNGTWVSGNWKEHIIVIGIEDGDWEHWRNDNYIDIIVEWRWFENLANGYDHVWIHTVGGCGSYAKTIYLGHYQDFIFIPDQQIYQYNPFNQQNPAYLINWEQGNLV